MFTVNEMKAIGRFVLVHARPFLFVFISFNGT